jgi:hypothetical protein
MVRSDLASMLAWINPAQASGQGFLGASARAIKRDKPRPILTGYRTSSRRRAPIDEGKAEARARDVDSVQPSKGGLGQEEP